MSNPKNPGRKITESFLWTKMRNENMTLPTSVSHVKWEKSTHFQCIKLMVRNGEGTVWDDSFAHGLGYNELNAMDPSKKEDQRALKKLFILNCVSSL